MATVIQLPGDPTRQALNRGASGVGGLLGNMVTQRLEEKRKIRDQEQFQNKIAPIIGTGSTQDQVIGLLRTGDPRAVQLAQVLGSQQGAQGFTLSPGQARFDAQGNPVAGVAPDRTEGRKEAFGNAKVLRQEFLTQSKPFKEVRDSFTRIRSVSKNPSAAGDLALIFNFMKMLDPGSVVRESEFRTAEDAKGWLGRMDKEGSAVPANVRLAIQKATTGQKLLPAQRTDFLTQADNLFQSQLGNQSELENIYNGLAQRAGVNQKDVVVDFRVQPDKDAPKETAGGALTGLPPGIPAGSKQIGTSGGKPVFESADGKRFIVD